ncbi:MAG: cupredoxin domain-containing protein [Thermodesulfobacteriota bacterium]
MLKKILFLFLAFSLFPALAFSQDVTFEVKISKIKFEPSHITVKKGQRVAVKFISTDVSHGITLKKFGLKKVVIKGKTEETVEFTADKSGVFTFPCTKYCSWRHLLLMRPRLTITVEE